MSKRILVAAILLGCLSGLQAQDAESGFDLRTVVSAGAFLSHRFSERPRFGDTYAAGFRTMLYPTWKISERWTVAGAVQVHSRPYFFEQFNTQGQGIRADVLQAHLSYHRFWRHRSLVVRAGQLSSAFGSFLLRYDDGVNPLIDMPLAYGYYYKPVTTYGLAGAQVDVTLGKVDLRAQFTNSAPVNRRSVFDKGQFGAWTGGAGYTIRQGLRLGVSAYRGPYLHRQYRFFRKGEADPRGLPATGLGLDVQWGHGPWTVNGEWQRFMMGYKVIPTSWQHTGYVEVKRTLHPRWYVAGRAGYLRASSFDGRDAYEVVVGYRPGSQQLIKAGYQFQAGPAPRGSLSNTLAVQFVTTLPRFSFAWR